MEYKNVGKTTLDMSTLGNSKGAMNALNCTGCSAVVCSFIMMLF